ncbi:hypothetical protein INR49_017673 [Caranx melampygus]|nr:hypothetical protein INR49_017673 [Caranx melampygus]
MKDRVMTGSGGVLLSTTHKPALILSPPFAHSTQTLLNLCSPLSTANKPQSQTEVGVGGCRVSVTVSACAVGVVCEGGPHLRGSTNPRGSRLPLKPDGR